jgi:hypothetical protein
MNKLLQSGTNITQDANGDYIVNFNGPLVNLKGKKYRSLEDYLHDVYAHVFETLAVLMREADELNGQLNNAEPDYASLFDENSFSVGSSLPSFGSLDINHPAYQEAINEAGGGKNNLPVNTNGDDGSLVEGVDEPDEGFGQYDEEHKRRFIYEPPQNQPPPTPPVKKTPLKKTGTTAKTLSPVRENKTPLKVNGKANPKKQAEKKAATKKATAKKTAKAAMAKADAKKTDKKPKSTLTEAVTEKLTDDEIKDYLDRAKASTTGLSNDYLLALVKMEGVALKMYDKDGSKSGNATVGIGNMIHTGKIGDTEADKKLEEPYKDGITRGKAFSDFVNGVNTRVDELNKMLDKAGIILDKQLYEIFFDIYWNGEGIKNAIWLYKDAGLQGLLYGLNATKPVYINTPTKKDPKHKTQLVPFIKSPNKDRKKLKTDIIEHRDDLYDKVMDIQNQKINENDNGAENTA